MWIVKFTRKECKIRLAKNQHKSNENNCILRIDIVPSRQILGTILENTLFQKLNL